MNQKQIFFKNASGYKLAAKLEMPEEVVIGYALFAHCFTCNKNFLAVRNIGRALNKAGIAVLRFDFTGLGESEGAFEQTNFSSNVQDLVAAARYLEEHHEAPKIIIGHSLGGAAVVFASQFLPGIKAVATLGAPSNPQHVTHLLKSGITEIEKKGEAVLKIGGRKFKIQKQFLDDLNEKNMEQTIRGLKLPLLVLHSPQDTTVGIENAAQIYQAAWHPKSFISLDGADHLLTDKRDSLYAGDMIAHWSVRYINF